MAQQHFNRRELIAGTATIGANLAMPTILKAQSKTLVAATFPGTWSEADRNVILPAFKAATGGASVTQSIVLGTDQVARLTAAKGNKPPFDVAFFDAVPHGVGDFVGSTCLERFVRAGVPFLLTV